MNSKQIKSINIPDDWSFVPIYDLRNKNDRYSFTGGPFGSDLKSEHYTDSGVRVIQLQNIGEGKFYNDNKIFTSEEKAKLLKSCLIYPDEIILAKMFPAGRSCKIPRIEEKFLMCSDGIRLSVDKSKYNNDFVFQALNTSYFLKAVQSQSTGTTRSRIGLNDLKIIPIAIPNSLPEQQKIAHILTTVDDKLENIESQIAEYTNLKTGLMQQLLTKGIGHEKFIDSELGMIPEGWEVVKLGDLGSFKSGGTPKTNISDYWNGDINWCTPTEITALNGGKYISKTERLITKKGLTNSGAELIPINSLLVCTRATIGDCAINLNEMTTNQGFKSIVPNEKVKIDYLYYLVNYIKPELIKNSSGSTFLEISKHNFAKIKIALPNIQEQKKISDILTAVDDKLESLQQKKEECDNLKKGLMEQLLTGRIRVKV